jgi:hypothetical protein
MTDKMAVLHVLGWEMARWEHEHEVPLSVTEFDWIEHLQWVVAEFPTGPTPLAPLYERIAQLVAVGMIVLGQLPHPSDIDGLDTYKSLFEG